MVAKDVAVVNWLSSNVRGLLARVAELETLMQKAQPTKHVAPPKPISIFDLLPLAVSDVSVNCQRTQEQISLDSQGPVCMYSAHSRRASGFEWNTQAKEFVPNPASLWCEPPTQLDSLVDSEIIVQAVEVHQSVKTLGHDRAQHLDQSARKKGTCDSALQHQETHPERDSVAASCAGDPEHKFGNVSLRSLDCSSCCDICLSGIHHRWRDALSSRDHDRQIQLCNMCLLQHQNSNLRAQQIVTEKRREQREFQLFEQVVVCPSRSEALQKLIQLGCEESDANRILEQGRRKNAHKRSDSGKDIHRSTSPPSPWQLFVKDYKMQQSGSAVEVAKVLSRLWCDPDFETERLRYERLSKDMKTAHDLRGTRRVESTGLARRN